MRMKEHESRVAGTGSEPQAGGVGMGRSSPRAKTKEHNCRHEEQQRQAWSPL